MTRSEEGSAFVLVLVLLTVLSLALGAMFANAGANLATSAVVSVQNNKAYAADGGVEFGIQQIRADSSLCRDPTQPQPVGSIPIDGRTVAVTCQPTAGQATSVSPWALITTEPDGPSLSTQGGGAKAINGAAYANGGIDLQSPLDVTNGDFLLNPATSACPTSTGGLVTHSPHQFVCPAATAIPTASLPDAPPGPSPPPFVSNGCTVWRPGTYSGGEQHATSLSLGPDNYFASGVYYLLNISLNLTSGRALGGQPGPDYPGPPTYSPGPACSSVTDQTAGVADGFGVEFILGGSSTISVGRGAQLELFPRLPASPSEGSAGISIRTVPSGQAGNTWEATDGHPAVLTTADQARLAVHGDVYVPQGSVQLGAATLDGGLVCWEALLDGQAGAVRISAQTGAQPRSVTITAQAGGLPAEVGQKILTSRAVVKIDNDPARTVSVQSWLTTSQ
jgi:hypothetical protein